MIIPMKDVNSMTKWFGKHTVVAQDLTELLICQCAKPQEKTRVGFPWNRDWKSYKLGI